MKHTWVAIYAIDALVVHFIPWMRAFPERVALGSLSTELGELKICLKAWSCRRRISMTNQNGEVNWLTLTRILLRRRPFQGSSGS
jgi:hypothetical protein